MSFLLIFILGVIANLAMAQGETTTYTTTTTTTTKTEEEETTKNPTARGGIKGGLNVSNLYVDDVDDENARFGFNVGLYAQLFSSEVLPFSLSSCIQRKEQEPHTIIF